MATLIICGHVFDGLSDTLLDRTEIMVDDHTISEMAASVRQSSLTEVIDLTDFTVMPRMIVPGLVPGQDNWRELWLLVQSGVAAVRVLQAATSVAAGLMGRADIGVLAPGKNASLIAVRGNPLVDISVVRQPDFEMVDGRVLRRPSRRRPSASRRHDLPADARRRQIDVSSTGPMRDARAST